MPQGGDDYLARLMQYQSQNPADSVTPQPAPEGDPMAAGPGGETPPTARPRSTGQGPDPYTSASIAYAQLGLHPRPMPRPRRPSGQGLFLSRLLGG